MITTTTFYTNKNAPNSAHYPKTSPYGQSSNSDPSTSRKSHANLSLNSLTSTSVTIRTYKSFLSQFAVTVATTSIPIQKLFTPMLSVKNAKKPIVASATLLSSVIVIEKLWFFKNYSRKMYSNISTYIKIPQHHSHSKESTLSAITNVSKLTSLQCWSKTLQLNNPSHSKASNKYANKKIKSNAKSFSSTILSVIWKQLKNRKTRRIS